MTSAQLIGYSLLQTSAITSIVSNRVFEGSRISAGTAGTIILPAINYYELAGGNRFNGLEQINYSINCRASTLSVANNLCREVINLFVGSSSTGIYGVMNSFDVDRISLINKQGNIFEETEDVWNCPVDIQLICRTGTIS